MNALLNTILNDKEELPESVYKQCTKIIKELRKTIELYPDYAHLNDDLLSILSKCPNKPISDEKWHKVIGDRKVYNDIVSAVSNNDGKRIIVVLDKYYVECKDTDDVTKLCKYLFKNSKKRVHTDDDELYDGCLQQIVPYHAIQKLSFVTNYRETKELNNLRAKILSYFPDTKEEDIVIAPCTACDRYVTINSIYGTYNSNKEKYDDFISDNDLNSQHLPFPNVKKVGKGKEAVKYVSYIVSAERLHGKDWFNAKKCNVSIINVPEGNPVNINSNNINNINTITGNDNNMNANIETKNNPTLDWINQHTYKPKYTRQDYYKRYVKNTKKGESNPICRSDFYDIMRSLGYVEAYHNKKRVWAKDENSESENEDDD